MAVDDFRQRREQRRTSEDASGVIGVQAHQFPVLDPQRAGSLPDPGRDGDAAKVVQEPGPVRRCRPRPTRLVPLPGRGWQRRVSVLGNRAISGPRRRRIRPRRRPDGPRPGTFAPATVRCRRPQPRHRSGPRGATVPRESRERLPRSPGPSARPDHRRTDWTARSIPPNASNMTAANPTAAKRAAGAISSPASPDGAPLPSKRSNAHRTASVTAGGRPTRFVSSAPTSQSARAPSAAIFAAHGAPASTRSFAEPRPRPMRNGIASAGRVISTRSPRERSATSSPPNAMAASCDVAAQPANRVRLV